MTRNFQYTFCRQISFVFLVGGKTDVLIVLLSKVLQKW